MLSTLPGTGVYRHGILQGFCKLASSDVGIVVTNKAPAKQIKQEMMEVVREDIELPFDQKNRMAFLLHNVLSPQECQDYIKRTEMQGYEQALVNIGMGVQRMMTDVRNSDRCIIDSLEDSDMMWQRIKPFIPSEWKGHAVKGLNERLRFLRYTPGQYFKPHFDGIYMRDNGERSYITLQLYLNEGFKGGSTTFLSMDSNPERKEVVPKTGTALIFEHHILHEGSELTKGVKYAVRTDIMYSPKIKESEQATPVE